MERFNFTYKHNGASIAFSVQQDEYYDCFGRRWFTVRDANERHITAFLTTAKTRAVIVLNAKQALYPVFLRNESRINANGGENGSINR